MNFFPSTPRCAKATVVDWNKSKCYAQNGLTLGSKKGGDEWKNDHIDSEEEEDNDDHDDDFYGDDDIDDDIFNVSEEEMLMYDDDVMGEEIGDGTTSDDFLLEWLQTLPVDEIDDADVEDGAEADVLELERLLEEQGWSTTSIPTTRTESSKFVTSEVISRKSLEKALMQGVVPAEAGVGSQCLPGDAGFDPLNFAQYDLVPQVQSFLLNLISPEKEDDSNDARKKAVKEKTPKRPAALILRDYREAEIRHGRLAMLAAIFWPLQEILDKLILTPLEKYDEDFTMLFGGRTLPYISLLMTACMLLLGYLDIYSNAIKEEDSGDAFLPGECFWDPLNLLDSTTAPQNMIRKMQEREIVNGRYAMIAFLVYVIQEFVFHRPLIDIPYNAPLFTPAFEFPAVQHWLDDQFSPHYDSIISTIVDESQLQPQSINDVQQIIESSTSEY